MPAVSSFLKTAGKIELPGPISKFEGRKKRGVEKQAATKKETGVELGQGPVLADPVAESPFKFLSRLDGLKRKEDDGSLFNPRPIPFTPDKSPNDSHLFSKHAIRNPSSQNITHSKISLRHQVYSPT